MICMVKIAILGFGVVGGGIADVLTANRALIEKRVGEEIAVARILDLRDFPNSPYGHLVTHDFNDILRDETISIVAEAMGGAHPAYDFSKAALEAGKSVVTSNKEVVAAYGAELLEIAAARGVRYLFEAAVGGGIPLIRPMICDLAANDIMRIDGILNGTTNYILTRMFAGGAAFDEALREAQSKGFAEANPAADVEGMDAARKIVILAALAFGKLLSPEKIYREGITRLTANDVAVAEALDCTPKLIGRATRTGERILASVCPRLVPRSLPLAAVNDVYNAVQLTGNMVGNVLFYGQGAGKLPTASAAVADITDIAAAPHQKRPAPRFTPAGDADYADFSADRGARVLCFATADVRAVRAVFPDARILSVNGLCCAVAKNVAEGEVSDRARAVGAPLASHLRMF